MKAKLLIFTPVAFAGLVALIAFSVASKNPQPPKKEPSRDRLKWHIAQAKKEGRQRVVISTGMSTYVGGENASVDTALADYTVVVAKPIAKRTYQRDDNNLRTWYTFQILDALTEFKHPACSGCFTLTTPSDLLPLNPDELLIPRDGGTVTLDGIEIEQTETGFPEFENNQRYLLFLSVYPNRVALTAGGPIGVFVIGNDEHLTSLNKNTDTIQAGMKERFDNSLSLVRKQLKHL
jgi:hypothetical protein